MRKLKTAKENIFGFKNIAEIKKIDKYMHNFELAVFGVLNEELDICFFLCNSLC